MTDAHPLAKIQCSYTFPSNMNIPCTKPKPINESLSMNLARKISRTGKHTATVVFLTCLSVGATGHTAASQAATDAVLRDLGKALFFDTALSRDGRVSCSSCHDPKHAYTDSRAHSIGFEGHTGVRNAPSLIGIADDPSFFWDGRRTRLEAVVLDPIANPVEFGWPSIDALLEKLRNSPTLVVRFQSAFPEAKPAISSEHLAQALSAFIRSLTTGNSPFDRASQEKKPLPMDADVGRKLFTGVAQCGECHRIEGAAPRFTDDQFHHSGIGGATQSANLPQLSQMVVEQHPDPAQIGPKVLTDADWSALGRFVVTQNPADIGAFRTPSLRNVAQTAPFMHDGSIATLAQAVDHEIYYRGFSRGRPINLSIAERQAIVAFLETLTDTP